MTYLKTTHDIAITNVGSAGAGTDLIGIMLARKPDGGIAYEEYDAQTFADQFYTGAASPVNINPEEELILTQDDWRSGFGLEYYDPNDSKRYFSSIGMDLRFRGMAICGSTPTAIVTDATNVPDIVNADFEIDGDATPLTGGWDYSVTGVSRSSTQARDTYSLQISATSTTTETHQYIKGWTPGVQYTFTCWIYTEWANGDYQGRIGLADGTQTVYCDFVEGLSFQQVTKTITVASNAKYLKLILSYKQAASGYKGYFDDAEIAMDNASGAITYGRPRAFAEYNDKLYTTFDKCLVELNSAGNRFSTIWQFGANITDLEAFTDDKFYICLGWSTAYEEMTTAFSVDGMTPNTLSNNTMKYMTTVFTTADTMYASDSNSTIRKTLDPKNGGTDWSVSATQVGADYHDITDTIENAGAFYVMKEDMPYYLDSSDVVKGDLAPELASLTTSTSGKNVFLWKKKLYIPCGQQGLLETDGTTNTFLNPARYCTNLSDFVGRVMAVAGDDEFLFVAIDNDQRAEILAGREETIDGEISWVWHPIAEISLVDVETMFVSSVYQKRLWIASTGETKILRPNAAGDETNIDSQVPSSGAHWDKVDEAVSDGDNTRIYTGKPDYERDLYNIDAHGRAGDETINSVTVYVLAKSGTSNADPSKQVSCKIVIKTSGTVYEDDAFEAEFLSYVSYSKQWTTNPSTSSAWTWSEITDLQIGISMRSSNDSGLPDDDVSVCTQVYVEVDYASSGLYYIPLPTGYGDMLNDANRKFNTGSPTFETSWLHGNFKADDKAWIKLTLTMGHTYNVGRYFTVKYKKYGDTSWNNIGDFAGSSSSMVESKFIDTTNKPFTSMMKFQFTAVTDDTNFTPVLHRFEAKAVMYPKIRRLIHCVVRCNDYMLTKGIPDEGKYSLIKTTLDNARNNPVWPISIRDIDGSTVNVKFLPVPKSMQRLLITRQPKDMRHDEREYHILMLEVETS